MRLPRKQSKFKMESKSKLKYYFNNRNKSNLDMILLFKNCKDLNHKIKIMKNKK